MLSKPLIQNIFYHKKKNLWVTNEKIQVKLFYWQQRRKDKDIFQHLSCDRDMSPYIKRSYLQMLFNDIPTMKTRGSYMQQNIKREVFKYIYLTIHPLKQSFFQGVLGRLLSFLYCPYLLSENKAGYFSRTGFFLLFFIFLFFPPVRIPVHPASSWVGNTKGTVFLGVFWYICFLFCLKQSRTVNTKTRKWKQRALNKIFFSSILRHLNLILCGILACLV